MNFDLLGSPLVICNDGAAFALAEDGAIRRLSNFGKECDEKAISFGKINGFSWICTNQHLTLFDIVNHTWAKKPLGRMPFRSIVVDYPNVFDVAGATNVVIVQGIDYLYCTTEVAKKITELTIPTQEYFYSGWWEDGVLYLAGMTHRVRVGSFPEKWGHPIVMKVVGVDHEIVPVQVGALNEIIKGRESVGNLRVEGVLDSIHTDATTWMVCPLIFETDDPYLLNKDVYLDFPLVDDYHQFMLMEFKHGVLSPAQHLSGKTYAGKLIRESSCYCYFPDASNQIINGAISLSILALELKTKNSSLKTGVVEGVNDGNPDSRISFYRFLFDESIGFYGCISISGSGAEKCFLIGSDDGFHWKVATILGVL